MHLTTPQAPLWAAAPLTSTRKGGRRIAHVATRETTTAHPAAPAGPSPGARGHLRGRRP